MATTLLLVCVLCLLVCILAKPPPGAPASVVFSFTYGQLNFGNRESAISQLNFKFLLLVVIGTADNWVSIFPRHRRLEITPTTKYLKYALYGASKYHSRATTLWASRVCKCRAKLASRWLRPFQPHLHGYLRLLQIIRGLFQTLCCSRFRMFAVALLWALSGCLDGHELRFY